MSATDILRWAYAHMEYPYALLFIIPLVIILFWILAHQFILLKEEPEVRMQKRKVRKMMYFTRTLIIVLLAIALASPYIQTQKTIDGDPFIELLIDNSTSMSMFTDYSHQLAEALQKRLNTEVRIVGADTNSNIGDAVLNNLKPHASVILLSDGQVNTGASLGDVALFATKLNSSVNAIRLDPVHSDASVTLDGPSKALEGSDNTFTATINRAGDIKSVHLVIKLDGETVYDAPTDQNQISFTKQLTKGSHELVAQIDVSDYFPNNNVFYKTVRVVPQPKVLLMSDKATPLEPLLKQLYLVDTATALPPDLTPYYAVVVNDLNADKANGLTDVLNDYTADGNGLVVFGGENSYDKGNYRNSIFETLLPVQVGAPEKKPGDTIVTILVDISGSSGAPFGRFKSTADFEKAATLGIITSLKPDTRVAVVAFNSLAYLISEPSPAFSKNLDDIVSRLQWGGGTAIEAGVLKAISIMGAYSGSKNIVLLSDGQDNNPTAGMEAMKYAANAGVKVYTVGVGPTTDEKFMSDAAEITNGVYFRATDESNLRLLFGPADEQQDKTSQMSLVILNKNHFITQGLEPNATLYGYNQVSPKGAASLLAVTSTGQPVLSIWRLGLGRVAAVSVDDGSKWAGSLLGAENSKLIVRTMNWAIGDPERKADAFIDAKDTRLDEPAEITIKSKQVPSAPGIVFYKTDEDTYTGNVVPTKVGFEQIAGAEFAVNYESEFEHTGQSKELENIVSSTGGKMFDVNDIDGMVEHAKSRAQRVVNDKEYLRWPLIVLAITIFLLEIFIRRIVRKE